MQNGGNTGFLLEEAPQGCQVTRIPFANDGVTGRQLPYPSESLGRRIGVIVENHDLVPRLQQGECGMTSDVASTSSKQNFHDGRNFSDCLGQRNEGWTG